MFRCLRVGCPILPTVLLLWYLIELFCIFSRFKKNNKKGITLVLRLAIRKSNIRSWSDINHSVATCTCTVCSHFALAVKSRLNDVKNRWCCGYGRSLRCSHDLTRWLRYWHNVPKRCRFAWQTLKFCLTDVYRFQQFRQELRTAIL